MVSVWLHRAKKELIIFYTVVYYHIILFYCLLYILAWKCWLRFYSDSNGCALKIIALSTAVALNIHEEFESFILLCLKYIKKPIYIRKKRKKNYGKVIILLMSLANT